MSMRPYLYAAALACAAGLFAQSGQQAEKKAEPATTNHRLSGPYIHDNLTLFLVHGEDRFQVKDLILLPEAMEQKKAIIHETQSVNELSVENLSATESVLILSGDILKGGQQDRFARFDQIVPPKSGKVTLNAFCVELTAARWRRELKGDDKSFQYSPGQVTSNSFRVAGRLYNDQRGVWNEVANAQAQLSRNAGVSVKAKESDSSLALSLDVKQVKEAAEKYVAKLQPTAEGKKDVVGFVYAVNGKVYAADVYGSSELFRRVWPRMIKAVAVEAFAELEKGKKVEPVTEAMVRSFMADAEKGKSSSQDIGKGVRQLTRDGAKNVQFESLDRGQNSPIRTNILLKSAPPPGNSGAQRQGWNELLPRQQPERNREPQPKKDSPPKR